MTLYDELIKELYVGDSPYAYADIKNVDNGYPHTNILEDLVQAILTEFSPVSWLEIGSMLGNSAIKVANKVKELHMPTTIVCIDPFTGDVNMWAWEKGLHVENKWKFLNLVKGKPSIYDRFLSNVVAAYHDDIIIPINCTSIVGINLLERLFRENRISHKPSIIYLDSAHEVGETFLELKKCWDFLPDGGILFGDDWDWPAVRNDVTAFFSSSKLNENSISRLIAKKEPVDVHGSLILYQNQWVACK